MKVLLDRGANPNAQLAAPLIERVHNNGDGALGAGATPLMRAAKKGDIEAMRVLVGPRRRRQRHDEERRHGADVRRRAAAAWAGSACTT